MGNRNQLWPVLRNNCTTNGGIRSDRLLIWLPPVEQRYQMEVREVGGEVVQPTAKGKSLGHFVPLTPREVGPSHGFQGRVLTPHLADEVPEPLLLRDYFCLTKAGRYQLRLVLLAIEKTKHGLKHHWLPVTVNLQIP